MENLSFGQMSRVERADKNGWYDDDTGFAVIHDYLVEVARSNEDGTHGVIRHKQRSINQILESSYRRTTDSTRGMVTATIYKVDGGKLIEIYYDENAVK